MKLKYLKGRKVWLFEMEDFNEVECPLPYRNLPDGQYLIRGTEKGHRREYWKLEDRWFLIDDVKKDNGHKICDIAIYQIFPNLTEREWENISKVGWKKLKKCWAEYYIGYSYWKQFRETRRRSRMSRIQILGY